MNMIKSLICAAALTTSGVVAAPAIAAQYSDEHVEWCTRTFQTYDASTNEYKTDQDARAKQCSSPYDDTMDVVVMESGSPEYRNPSFDMEAQLDEGTAKSHEEWCADTHPTWDEASNTYETESGMKKLCSSPFN